jgi:hypothetical protein
MLENLSLRNFKSARHLDVPLSQLTVLSGLNGSGKSTVLQAIGLLRQSLQISHVSAEQRTKLSNLHLRGPLVQLGMAGDVLSQRASEYEVEITLNLNTPDSRWAFTANIDKEYMDADTLSAKDYYNPNARGIMGMVIDPNPESSAAQNYLRDCHFQFLQADRLTPSTHYERSDTTDRGLGFLGTGGQYTPDFLHLLDQGSRNSLAKYRIDVFERPEGPPTWDTEMKAWVTQYRDQLLRSWTRCQQGGFPFELEK